MPDSDPDPDTDKKAAEYARLLQLPHDFIRRLIDKGVIR